MKDVPVPTSRLATPRGLALSALLLAGLFALPAQARDTTAMRSDGYTVAQTATSHTSGTKARKKPKARQSTVQQAPPRPVWTGPDPTKGPGIERLRQLQREGRCVIDEGYGRFTYCSDR